MKAANQTVIPWNTALNTNFKQVNAWDIYNYPSNYRALMPNKTIKAGTKQLTFNRVQGKKDTSGTGGKTSLVQTKTTFAEDQKLQQSLLISNSTKKA